MLRDTRPDLLLDRSPSAFRPGVHVCPWGAPGGGAAVTLVSRGRVLLATVYCSPDDETVDAVKAELATLWNIIDPAPAKPELRLIG